MNEGLVIKANFVSRLKGLLPGILDGRNALFMPCHDVHTFGMHHSLDIAFVDSNGVVLTTFRRVGPNRRVRDVRAAAVVERFAEEGPWFKAGDRLYLSNQND